MSGKCGHCYMTWAELAEVPGNCPLRSARSCVFHNPRDPRLVTAPDASPPASSSCTASSATTSDIARTQRSSASTTRSVERMRQTGFDPGRIYGLSSKENYEYKNIKKYAMKEIK